MPRKDVYKNNVIKNGKDPRGNGQSDGKCKRRKKSNDTKFIAKDERNEPSEHSGKGYRKCAYDCERHSKKHRERHGEQYKEVAHDPHKRYVTESSKQYWDDRCLRAHGRRKNGAPLKSVGTLIGME